MINSKVFRKSSLFSTRDMMKKHKNQIRMTYSLLNIFLWLQGIGFTRGILCDGKNLLVTLASMVLLIIQDGNFIYLAYVYTELIRGSGIYKAKAELATVIIGAMNLALRFLFYARRRLLQDGINKLEKIYARTCEEDNKICMFRLKLTLFIISNKILPIIHLCHLLQNIKPDIAEYAPYGIIPPPYALPCLYVSLTLNSIGFVDLAVAAYFCIVCFALKEALRKFRQRLLNDRSDRFLERYCQIADVIAHCGNLLHPFLVITFMSILTTVFRESYYAVFVSAGADAVFNVFNAFMSFLQFVVICVSSSSVIRAVEEIKTLGNNLPTDVMKPKLLRFVLQINDGFAGFKVLNSMAIDLSLILRFVGALLTYGILIATFSSNSSV